MRSSINPPHPKSNRNVSKNGQNQLFQTLEISQRFVKCEECLFKKNCGSLVKTTKLMALKLYLFPSPALQNSWKPAAFHSSCENQKLCAYCKEKTRYGPKKGPSLEHCHYLTYLTTTWRNPIHKALSLFYLVGNFLCTKDLFPECLWKCLASILMAAA